MQILTYHFQYHVHIHCSYLNIQLISQTVISSYVLGWPTRHWTFYWNILLTLIYNIFDITLFISMPYCISLRSDMLFLLNEY